MGFCSCYSVCVIDPLLGLRYDDLYDPKHDLDIKEALERLPREVVDARHQRLKRAMDLSMKHQYLSENDQVRSFPSCPDLVFAAMVCRLGWPGF